MNAQMISPLQLRQFTKFAYRHRGLARVAEKIRCRQSQSRGVIQISDFDEDLKFVCDLSEHMASQIFWKGYYSEDQLRALEKIIKPDMTFVDVGANHGEFTLFAAKRLSRGRIIAFEPAGENFRKLETNVTLNGFNNITLVQSGVGDSTGEIQIYRSKKLFSDGTTHKGLHSQFVGREQDAEVETIRVLPLDTYVAQNNVTRVDIMKIDVEGAELAVLRGAESTLAKHQPIICIEINESTSSAAGYKQDALLDHLAQRGYRFELIVPWGWGKTEPLNTAKLTDFQNVLCFPAGRNSG